MLNAITIDLEDWAQAVLDQQHPITDRVLENTDRVLDLLRRSRIRATFFVLGKVCEHHPRLLPAIASEGHEIASHGYGHELVFRLSPADFRADLVRSIEIIQDQVGIRPLGYRAPAFSITNDSLWAVPILKEVGFAYSSSVFPIRHRRYGISDAPREPFDWPAEGLREFPISTACILGRRLPFVGGGYTRLIPGALSARIIRRLNRQGQPAVIYMHPYELAPGEVAWFQAQGTSVRWRRRFTQELWRSRVRPRLERLFGEFPFGPMATVLKIGPA